MTFGRHGDKSPSTLSTYRTREANFEAIEQSRTGTLGTSAIDPTHQRPSGRLSINSYMTKQGASTMKLNRATGLDCCLIESRSDLADPVQWIDTKRVASGISGNMICMPSERNMQAKSSQDKAVSLDASEILLGASALKATFTAVEDTVWHGISCPYLWMATLDPSKPNEIAVGLDGIFCAGILGTFAWK